ncbi:MAG: DUF3592 domain-containing protein [Lentisphaeraceae bacterium]|nr:DUF3592 domain-containing protein [Lentisphaeraceae bacterium]
MLVFIVFGSSVSYFGFTNGKNGKESPSWPTVNGTVTRSKVKFSSNGYFPSIMYRYTIDGKEYETFGIDYGRIVEGSQAHAFAKNIVKRFPLGSQVDVYYDPLDPGESVLIPGGTSASWFIVAFGGVFIFIGLLVPISFVRKMLF